MNTEDAVAARELVEHVGVRREAEGVRPVRAARIRLLEQLGDVVEARRRGCDRAADTDRGSEDPLWALPSRKHVAGEVDLQPEEVAGQRHLRPADPSRTPVRP